MIMPASLIMFGTVGTVRSIREVDHARLADHVRYVRTQISPNRTPPKKCVRVIVIDNKNFIFLGLCGGDPRMGLKMREIHVFDFLSGGGRGGPQKSPNRTPPKKCVRLIVILLENFNIFGLGGGDPRMRPRM